MAIYELFAKESFDDPLDELCSIHGDDEGGWFSKIIARFCFLLLLAVDAAWFAYNVALMVLFGFIHLFLGRRFKVLGRLFRKHALNLRRSAVCALALVAGLFSPPFGIMIACTYFLMYDKTGMEEVVPEVLQAQFKDVF